MNGKIEEILSGNGKIKLTREDLKSFGHGINKFAMNLYSSLVSSEKKPVLFSLQYFLRAGPLPCRGRRAHAGAHVRSHEFPYGRR